MKSKTFLLTIIVFWLLNFLGLTNFSNTTLLIVLVPSYIIGISKTKNIKDCLFKPFLTIFIGLVLCCISSNIYEGQTWGECFNGLTLILPLFLVYYTLKAHNVKSPEVLLALKYASVIYCFFYILNYVLITYGLSIINVSETALEAGSEARIRLPGSMLISYLFFASLNEYLVNKKFTSLIFILLPLIVLFIMAFRTMIAGLLLCTILEITMINGFNKKFFKYSIIGIILTFLLYNIPIIQEKLNYMIEKQSQGNETFGNKDYIRLITFNYFMNDFFHNNIEMFLGSGPLGYGSTYTAKLNKLSEAGIYPVDWGLIGNAWIYGLTTVLGWIYFSIKMIFCKWNPSFKFLSVLYIYLLLVSITTVEFSRSGNFVIHGMVLYLLNSESLKQKSKKTNNENRNYNIS